MADTDVLHLSLPAVYGQEINRIGSVAARPFAGAFPAENSPTAATASFIFETELSLAHRSYVFAASNSARLIIANLLCGSPIAAVTARSKPSPKRSGAKFAAIS